MTDAQLEGLNRSLHRIVRHNDFYARAMRIEGEIRSYEDFVRRPFMTKEILQKGYPFSFACADRKDFARMHMSSGTTGTPVLNPMTRHDVDQWRETMGRCFTTATLTSEDTIQITPSFGLFNGGFGFHYGAESIRAFTIPIGAGRSHLQLRFMEELGTTALGAIASYPLRLMEIAREEGFDFRKRTQLRVGIIGAEVWSDSMRKRIEDVMGIETFDIIGMTETGGVGLGIDCVQHDGIHIWDDHYIVEIIDPESGDVVPDGVEGEMVLTTLTREGLPLVRYRTRDVTRIVSRGPCPCGLSTVKIARIKGRNDDMLKVKGVNFYPSQLEAILMSFTELSTEYQIVLEEKHGKGIVTLIAETLSGIDEEVETRIHTRLRDFLGFRVTLQFVPFGTLPRSDGKAQRVVDRRGPSGK